MVEMFNIIHINGMCVFHNAKVNTTLTHTPTPNGNQTIEPSFLLFVFFALLNSLMRYIVNDLGDNIEMKSLRQASTIASISSVQIRMLVHCIPKTKNLHSMI